MGWNFLSFSILLICKFVLLVCKSPYEIPKSIKNKFCHVMLYNYFFATDRVKEIDLLLTSCTGGPSTVIETKCSPLSNTNPNVLFSSLSPDFVFCFIFRNSSQSPKTTFMCLSKARNVPSGKENKKHHIELNFEMAIHLETHTQTLQYSWISFCKVEFKNMLDTFLALLFVVC